MATSSSKTESSGNGEQATRLLDTYHARYPNTPFRRSRACC
jgi:hypothetical protein